MEIVQSINRIWTSDSSAYVYLFIWENVRWRNCPDTKAFILIKERAQAAQAE